MKTPLTSSLPLVIALLLACSAAPAAAKTDPALKCKAKIIESAGNFFRKTTNALQKCRNAVLTGALPADTDCETEPKMAAALAGHERSLERTIERNCGGDDNTCNTSDDIPLAAIGWTIGNCPGLPGTGCTNAINGCADIADCLACIGRGGVDRVIALSYDQLAPTDSTQKAVRKCQVAIGKAAAKFVGLKSKALGTCWSAVNKQKAPGPCPAPGDGKAADAIAAAAARLSSSICKACGGPDKVCGGGDDVTRADIGFPGICPGTAAAARFTPCSEVVLGLSNLVSCVECITEFGVDCADRAAVPYLAMYPAACKPDPGVLDFTKPPVFGSTALTSGFVPDPFTVGVTAGGGVNVSYLGGGCTGFATSAPSFSVNYTQGAFPTLRFFFVGSGDTTMVINTPSANFVCVDDSFGTLNPTIDFNSPASGRYDVWVGTFAGSTSVGGTLSVTENTGNHP
jgi:hypothetical protein